MKRILRRSLPVFCGLLAAAILLEGGLRLGGRILLFIQGFRDPSLAHANGECRILCLGESTTAGGVDGYPAQLEEILNASGAGVKFIVINRGIPSIDTGVILRDLPRNLDECRPALVVAMMGINDHGPHMAYRARSRFLRSLRIVNLAKWLWLRIRGAPQEEGAGGERPAVRMNPVLQDVLADYGDAAKGSWEAGARRLESGDWAGAQRVFQDAVKAFPQSAGARVALGLSYHFASDLDRAEREYREALRLSPHDANANLLLGLLYATPRYDRKLGEAEALLRKAVAAAPAKPERAVWLADLCLRQGRPAEAEKVLLRAVEIDRSLAGPEYRLKEVYGTLARICAETGRPDLAAAYDRKFKDIWLDSYQPDTQRRYVRLRRMLDQRGIPLLAVQYPMLSLEPLSRMLAGEPGVVFVDNERIFKDAVAREGYAAYFVDSFAGEFGHGTPKGGRLLAWNVARVLLKERFRKELSVPAFQ